MQHQYAQAFLASLESGMSIDTALSGLRAALAKKQHEKLLGPVLLEVLRVLEAGKGSREAVVSIATDGDRAALKAQISAALSALGASSTTPVTEVVDETLIGGFVATYNFTEHDASYKKVLTNLYESIVK